MAEIKNWAKRPAALKQLDGLYTQITEGFEEEKRDQNDRIKDFWDIYNCVLSENQAYSGDSVVFDPAVRDGIDARIKRFVAMLFPTTGNNVEVVSEDGVTPQQTMSMLQRNIRFTGLRDTIVPSCLLNGDIEGQWSLMLDWKRSERTVTRKKLMAVEGVDEVEDIETETVVDEGPDVTVIAAQDLLVYPATVNELQDAEMVTVALRLTKDQIEQKVEEGWFVKSAADKLNKEPGKDWAAKERAADAGIKIKSGKKFALVYACYKKLKLEGDKKEPAIIYFGGPTNILGIVKNPFWSQKVPIISKPINKVAGSFWGKSKVDPVTELQYQLNDIVNMGQDSATYCLLPIVMTDPLKNPRVQSMIYGLAAIWETNPTDTQIVSFPDLYKNALVLEGNIKQKINQSLEVNEAMLGQAPPGRKNAQAIAAQSAEALATIGDFVKRFEFGMLDQLLEWYYELDAQFRTTDLVVKIDGEQGLQSVVETIPPQQMNYRMWFKWNGTDAVAGAQRTQQQIALMNVLRGIPPQQLNGRRLDIGPILDNIVQSTFGPTLTKNILIDESHQMKLEPEMENQFLHNGFEVPTMPLDDDAKHIQLHEQAAHETADLKGNFRRHIAKHVQQMQAKQAQMQPKGQPGMPGGAGPGVAGTPTPGAQPGQPRPMQQPPGAIHQDQMQDPNAGMRG